MLERCKNTGLINCKCLFYVRTHFRQSKETSMGRLNKNLIVLVVLAIFLFGIMPTLFCQNNQNAEYLLNSLQMEAKDLSRDSALTLVLNTYKKLTDSMDLDDCLTGKYEVYLGDLTYDLGDYSKAIEYLQTAGNNLAECKSLRPGLPEISLLTLGKAFHAKGNYQEAKNVFEHLELLLKDNFNSTDSLRVQCAVGQALNYFYLGDYQTAESLFLNILNEIRGKYGPDNYLVADIEAGLGRLEFEKGNINKAEELQSHALKIRKNRSNIQPGKLAESLDRLGALYSSQGNYADALPLFEEAIGLEIDICGKLTPQIANKYINLAIVYINLGKYDEGRQYYAQALKIYSEYYGEVHAAISTCYEGLGYLAWISGRRDSAEYYYGRSVAVAQKALGDDNYDVVVRLNNYASILYANAKYDESEQAFLNALRITKNVFGSNHPQYANSLYGLAWLYYERQNYQKASLLVDSILTIKQTFLGRDHPEIASLDEEFCELYFLLGNYEKCFDMSARAFQIRLNSFIHNSVVLSEDEALNYAENMRSAANTFISLYSQYASQQKPSDRLNRILANIIVSAKGNIADGIFERQRTIIYKGDSNLIDMAERLKNVKCRIANQYLSEPSDDNPQLYRIVLDSLSNLANALDAQLNRSSAELS